jgi:hypothetical protein
MLKTSIHPISRGGGDCSDRCCSGAPTTPRVVRQRVDAEPAEASERGDCERVCVWGGGGGGITVILWCSAQINGFARATKQKFCFLSWSDSHASF